MPITLFDYLKCSFLKYFFRNKLMQRLNLKYIFCRFLSVLISLKFSTAFYGPINSNGIVVDRKAFT